VGGRVDEEYNEGDNNCAVVGPTGGRMLRKQGQAGNEKPEQTKVPLKLTQPPRREGVAPSWHNGIKLFDSEFRVRHADNSWLNDPEIRERLA
jgi:hypothetical protein